MAYSSNCQRFWGKNDEDWLTKLNRYQFMCAQNKVTGSDKVSFLHYMLDGAALQFFINEIEGKLTNYGEVMRRFHERYASAAKQDYISHQLSEIHISNFETQDNFNEGAAFRAMVDEIDRLTPMSHPEDRTDRAKTLHLQQAVLGKDWARTVLSNVTANELRYHNLIERLEYSLQQWAKHLSAHSRAPHYNSNQIRSTRWKATNFAGQARYGREPRSNASIVPKQFNRDGRVYPKEHWPQRDNRKDLLTCHNCGKTGCRWFKCKEPVDMKRVLRNRMHAAQENTRRRGSFGINFNKICDDLARDMMEIMLTSTEDGTNGDGYDRTRDITEEKAQEELMSKLEDASANAAAIHHNAVRFELAKLPHDELGQDSVNGDPDEGDFGSGV